MNQLVTKVTDLIKKQPLAVTLVVFVVGALLGWMVLGWGLFPVEYVDGEIHQLRSDLQQDYVRLVASAYVLDGDAPRAGQRIARLGANAPQIVKGALDNSTGNDAIRVSQLQLVLESTGALGQPGAAAPQPSLMDRLRLPLLACGLVLVLGLVGGYLYLRTLGAPPRGRGAAVKPATSRVLSAEAPPSETAIPAAASPTGKPPIARFMTTYTLGDDNYDDSFSVDGPDGNFLGECGMGISETIGVGDPKKVTAFEVWLFDKNDIRTVTKVMMSEHAFRDESLKSRLAAKGEPVVSASGDTVTLETATLIVMARVVDMAYGGGALPHNSFFERMTMELAAYKKEPAG